MDFSLARYEDGLILLSMVPPTNVSSWSQLQFQVMKRLGGVTPLITKSMNALSGFTGVSGVVVNNSAQGVFAININSVDSSGLDFGNYAFNFTRLDSGSYTDLTEGLMLLMPSVGG